MSLVNGRVGLHSTVPDSHMHMMVISYNNNNNNNIFVAVHPVKNYKLPSLCMINNKTVTFSIKRTNTVNAYSSQAFWTQPPII